MSKTTAVYFVGYNTGWFGLGHDTPQHKPIKCTNKLITKVYPSNCFSIYSDDNHKKLFAAGFKDYEWATNSANNCTLFQRITYFEENQINVKKTCVSMAEGCIFFITDQGQLYGYWDDRNQGLFHPEESNTADVSNHINKTIIMPWCSTIL